MNIYTINAALAVFAAIGLTACSPHSTTHSDPHSNQHTEQTMTYDFTASNAITITRSGSFDLDMTPDAALPLFTAPGEKLWIPTWEPMILNGDGFEKGTVFVTAHAGHKTYWHVMDYDTGLHHALYVRVTPGVDTGTVDVSLVPNESGGSTVTVSYQLTSLSTAGSTLLQKNYSAEKYAQMMEEWRSMIVGSRDKIDAHFSR